MKPVVVADRDEPVDVTDRAASARGQHARARDALERVRPENTGYCTLSRSRNISHNDEWPLGSVMLSKRGLRQPVQQLVISRAGTHRPAQHGRRSPRRARGDQS